MKLDPPIHPRSKKALDALTIARPHAILLHGPRGIGLVTVAHWLANRINRASLDLTDLYPDKTGITIDQIRSLYALTRSKYDQHRVIILHQTDLMADAAQAAFLKLLEEPTQRTTFILLSHLPERLLSTIHSRTQEVELLPLDQEQTNSLLDDLGVTDRTLRQQLQFVANGLPEELDRLARDDTYRQMQFAHAASAKQLLAGPLYERLQLITTLSSDRQVAHTVLDLVSRILSAELVRNPHNTAALTKLNTTLTVIERLHRNGNLKLQLLQLVLSA